MLIGNALNFEVALFLQRASLHVKLQFEIGLLLYQSSVFVEMTHSLAKRESIYQLSIIVYGSIASYAHIYIMIISIV